MHRDGSLVACGRARGIVGAAALGAFLALYVPACAGGGEPGGPKGGTGGGGSTPGLTADALEPNDLIATAAPVALGFSRTGLTIHTATDRDHFTFSVGPQTTVDVTLSFANAAGNLDLEVYSTVTGNLIAISNGTSNGEYLSFVSATGGTYTVRVLGANGATNRYDLSIQQGGGGGAIAADSFEPNDTAATAYALNWSPAVALTLQDLSLHDAIDTDFFSLSLAAQTSLTISLTFNSAYGGVLSDIDLDLTDAGGNVVAFSNGTGNTESISTTLAPGTYYLEIYWYQANPSGNTYSLTIQ